MRIDRSKRLICETGKLTAVATGGLQSIESLKAAGRESDFFARWAAQQARYSNVQQEMTGLMLVFSKFPFLLTAMNSTIVLAVGSLQIMNGTFTVGGLVAFQLLMPNLLQPFGQLVQLLGTIQNLEGSMDRLDDVLDSEIDPAVRRVREEGKPLSVTGIKLSGELGLEGVTFGYSRLEEPLIRDFSLTIKPAARVAVVGASGSGKSTIAKLVTGLYQPWSGAITIDGMPLETIPRPLFSNSVAMVDQEIFLFEGTIRENLTLWDTSIPSEDMVAAARDAVIHDDISQRPNGYESKVEEMGANFSGGQRQRLEIARALVNNPILLVLDEATSALDPSTEKAIDDRLRKRGCACLIIAHRLSTIRDCDEIIVLEKGVVVQRGTHDAMKDVDGPYRRLIQTG
jgi:ABC-type bacteriocin/lantibiotic exporter with double-glycine peptidase domain